MQELLVPNLFALSHGLVAATTSARAVSVTSLERLDLADPRHGDSLGSQAEAVSSIDVPTPSGLLRLGQHTSGNWEAPRTCVQHTTEPYR